MTTDTAVPITVLYHGCWGGIGHYLFDKNRNLLRNPAFRAWEDRAGSPSKFIDNGLSWACKRKLPGIPPETEGVAKVTHLIANGFDWTVLGFWDRSVDSRYNSWSMFIATGTYDFDRMVELAKQNFPQVWARYKFNVIDGTDLT